MTQKIFIELKKILSKLTIKQKKIAALLLSAGVVVIAAGIFLIEKDPKVILFTNISREELRAITKKLSQDNVTFSTSVDGATIYVPQSRVSELRMSLAKDGLPSQDVVGFEKFDGTTLGMSSYVQRIQYVRAVQGELVRSIEKLNQVERARVHISLPPKRTFLEDKEEPKASVIVELYPGMSLSRQEIQGIGHLVSSAVEGLKPNQVTILDTKGNFLRKPEDDESNENRISSTLFELGHSMESDYQKRIEELLTPLVGSGKVRAKVALEMDSRRVNTTEETFDPTKTLVKSITKNEESTSGQRPNAAGIAGSRANLPGAEAAKTPPPLMSQTSSEKSTQNTNYAIPRKVQVIDKPSGSIKRMSIAVVVDGYYQKNAKGESVFSPRPDDEIKRLEEIVSNAVGFDAERRDSLTVTSLPFTSDGLLSVDEAPPLSVPLWKKPYVQSLILSFLGILSLLSILFVLFRWIQQAGSNKEASTTQGDLHQVIEEANKPLTIRELEERLQKNQKFITSTEEVSKDPTKELLLSGSPLKKESDELLNLILERMGKSPKKALRIVQDWLEEDSHLVSV